MPADHFSEDLFRLGELAEFLQGEGQVALGGREVRLQSQGSTVVFQGAREMSLLVKHPAQTVVRLGDVRLTCAARS